MGFSSWKRMEFLRAENIFLLENQTQNFFIEHYLNKIKVKLEGKCEFLGLSWKQHDSFRKFHSSTGVQEAGAAPTDEGEGFAGRNSIYIRKLMEIFKKGWNEWGNLTWFFADYRIWLRKLNFLNKFEQLLHKDADFIGKIDKIHKNLENFSSN